MYRKELGVHFKPYYDEGDYQVEIDVFDRGYIGDSGIAHDFMGGVYAPEQQAILNMARIGEYTRDNMSETEFNLKVTEDARQIEDQRKGVRDYCFNKIYIEDKCNPIVHKIKKKKDYHTPRLYLADDLPFIHSTFDWINDEVVCMDLGFLQGYKQYVISRIVEVS